MGCAVVEGRGGGFDMGVAAIISALSISAALMFAIRNARRFATQSCAEPVIPVIAAALFAAVSWTVGEVVPNPKAFAVDSNESNVGRGGRAWRIGLAGVGVDTSAGVAADGVRLMVS